MDAKKCDRCGIYYQEREATAFEALGHSFIRITEMLNPELGARNNIIRELEKHCDLCPECSASLKNWLKEGTKNEQSKRTSDGYNAGKSFIDELPTSKEQ